MKPATDDICPNCKQPKPGGTSGSLTQWIFVCHCASLKAPATEESDVESHRFQVCRKCRKRVNTGREGSLTQFVFRSDSCRCDIPEVLDVAIARPVLGADTLSTEAAPDIFGDDIVGLDLPPESFPTERFKPIRELGRGASGAVYLCIDRLLGNYVAVKTLHHLSSDQLLSFQQEARAISRLTHPNIVRILDFGATESGIPYMVLEHIDGVDLETFVAQHGPLSLDEIVDVGSSVCDALSYSHSKEIFHRDLKPSNMLIEKNNDRLSAKLVDFGVARVKFETTTPTVLEGTSVIGTPAYMSPDQMKGISFDQRSEVYSLGCILFELLTGRQIYAAESVLEIVSMHVNAPIPKLREAAPDVTYPPGLDEILGRCLAKKPEERYQSMADAKAALEEIHSRNDVSSIGSDHQRDGTESGAQTGANHEYTDAIQQALRAKSVEGDLGLDTAARARAEKRMATSLGAGVAVIALLIGGAIFFMSGLNKTSPEDKKDKVNSVNKPGTLANTLLETKYQINNFDGNHWTFNMGEVKDDTLDELFHPKEPDDSKRLWFDSGYLSPAGILKLEPLGVVAFAIINLEMTDKHFENLAKFKTLKALRLYENPGLKNEHLGIIKNMDNLKELFIRSENISDAGVAQLAGMKNLKYLSLDRCRHLTDKCLDTIEGMKNLERLSVTETGISINGVHRIANMKNLKTICISHLPCDKSCIKELAKLNPERLALRYAPLDQSDILFLGGVKNLKLLDVRDSHVKKAWEPLFYQNRTENGLPYCRLIRERRTGIDVFGEMVFDTLDDEHMWTDSLTD